MGGMFLVQCLHVLRGSRGHGEERVVHHVAGYPVVGGFEVGEEGGDQVVDVEAFVGVGGVVCGESDFGDYEEEGWRVCDALRDAAGVVGTSAAGGCRCRGGVGHHGLVWGGEEKGEGIPSSCLFG